MKLADLASGPDWGVWIVFVIFAVLSIVLLSGHGSWVISGYNTASKEEKEKYDEKKLCRTMGIGMSIISILILIMGLFESVLPAFCIYIAVELLWLILWLLSFWETRYADRNNFGFLY